MDIKLYQTTDTIKALCLLVEKIYVQGKRVQIVCADELTMSNLDQALWQFKQLSFIPHMTDYDHVNPQDETIFITLNNKENLNQADVIINYNMVSETRNCESLVGICNAETSVIFLKHYTPSQHFIQNSQGQWLATA